MTRLRLAAALAADHEGKPACFLCSELPTLQNGLAKIEDLGDGRRGPYWAEDWRR